MKVYLLWESPAITNEPDNLLGVYATREAAAHEMYGKYAGKFTTIEETDLRK